MANMLIVWQGGETGRLSAIASAVAAGASTVRATEVRLSRLRAADIDRLRWCDGLVVGVYADPRGVIAAMDAWRHRLEPRLWDAVQGKFASVFAASPGEARKRARAQDCAVRLLTGYGMLVTGFGGTDEDAAASTGSSGQRFQHEFERLGRLSAGMAHAWSDGAGHPRHRRVIRGLVRATRRVPAMRPEAAMVASGSASDRIPGRPETTPLMSEWSQST